MLQSFILFQFQFQGEELRQRLRELEERERREGKKMADEEALRKIRSVEEQIDMLNKKLSIAKQVCGLIFVCLSVVFESSFISLTLCLHLAPCLGGGCPAE